MSSDSRKQSKCWAIAYGLLGILADPAVVQAHVDQQPSCRVPPKREVVIHKNPIWEKVEKWWQTPRRDKSNDPTPNSMFSGAIKRRRARSIAQETPASTVVNDSVTATYDSTTGFSLSGFFSNLFAKVRAFVSL